ncbi:hypothetical protein [Streptomyces sp. 8N706]|uniref:hypothetical protein n=1 Tax=Streptomyces sp. 8N706 TaxID=3457416 RepID=UPI003FD325A9
MADFFDRLLARHAPAPPAGPAGGVVRLRPRLPGPFERAGAAAEPPELDGAAPDGAAAPERAADAVTFIERARETRTDHRTVVRTEAAEPGPPHPAPAPAAGAPLLRPPARIAPEPRPAPRTPGPGRPDAPAAEPAAPLPRSAASVSTPPGTGAAPPAAAPPRPRPTTAATARTAARAAAGRRQQKPAERVVHVQIGRLEVTATGGQSRPPRPERPGRARPVLALDAYLSREEKRS